MPTNRIASSTGRLRDRNPLGPIADCCTLWSRVSLAKDATVVPVEMRAELGEEWQKILMLNELQRRFRSYPTRKIEVEYVAAIGVGG